ncbi:MAG: hypothetical protein MJ014_05365, partial [Methanocorpusculum sp.]|nr:hypothetical protein [Methanocorpusculum sp.]
TQIFKGTFDGKGWNISNMNGTVISTSSGVYAGLFGYVDHATIRNVSVVNANVTVTSSFTHIYSGGLMGFATHSSITNCYATSVVTAPCRSGGLAGHVEYTTIMNCYATGAVTAKNTIDVARPDGLVGQVEDSTIMNCYATGVVTAESSPRYEICAGGLVGLGARTTIENCYATGAVTAASPSSFSQLGGLMGYASRGSITNSVALNQWVNASGSGPINTGVSSARMTAPR